MTSRSRDSPGCIPRLSHTPAPAPAPSLTETACSAPRRISAALHAFSGWKRAGAGRAGRAVYAGAHARVCLASTSPARLMLLQQAGIEPRRAPPPSTKEGGHRGDRDPRGSHIAPDEHVLVLARRKAADVAATVAAEDRSSTA
ncbi:MAG: Maf family protein [Microbacterium sp.]